jgi:hypothetical protein
VFFSPLSVEISNHLSPIPKDWSALEVDVETIYPSYYLIITAMFMLVTVYSLVASKLMG